MSRPRPSPAAHVQMPRALLRSPDHGPLALVVWATYEDLAAPGLGGGRVPARARRRVVAEAYGTSTTAVDDARRELLAVDVPGGPWLQRSSPQGAKRAVRHLPLRLPRDTGEPYVRLPRWTRELVWAGRARPAGQISPAAWRLYGHLVDRTGNAGGTTDAGARELGALLGGGADTSRRRLAELETAGLVAVTERPGARPTVRVIVDQAEAELAAARYAEQGREQASARPNPPATPSDIAAFTPRVSRHSPPANSGTPQETPVSNPACGEPPVPAVGANLQHHDGLGAAAGAGDHHAPSEVRAEPERPRATRSAAAAQAYRALPAELRRRIPEHGSRRVLRMLAAELTHRTVAELATRIADRWEAWRYRPEDIHDPTAVAITVVRRGYDCPDVRCEAHHRLDTGNPCGHCDQARPTEALSGPQAPEQASPNGLGSGRSSQRPTGALSASPRVDAADYEPYVTLARRLLTARTDAERNKIINEAGKIN